MTLPHEASETHLLNHIHRILHFFLSQHQFTGAIDLRIFMGFRRMIYVENNNISKIEQNQAKKGLSHTWIALVLLAALMFSQVFEATVGALQKAVIVAVDV